MTIVEASSKLFDWFSKNDYFSLEKNLQSLTFITETAEEDRACVKCALEDFEKLEFIRCSEGAKGKKVWVLKKSFDSFEQSVSINVDTAKNIASIINAFCDSIKDHSDECDPRNITQKDIKNVVIICQHMSKGLAEK